MSVEVLAWTMRNSEAKLGDRLVVFALADHAKADGTSSWPAVETLGEYARLSKRQVQRCLRNLESAGEILHTGDSKKGTRIYSFPRYIAATQRGVNMSPLEGGGGDISDRGGVTPTSPDPSLDPSLDPKGSSARNEIQRVYEHWRQARGKMRLNYVTMSDARRTKIRLRLKEFTADELCAAIDNVARDPWPDRGMHDDITIIFRSREQVDKFLELGADKAAAKRGLGPAKVFVESSGWQYPEAALVEELRRYDLTAVERNLMVALAGQLRLEHKGEAA